MALDRLGAELLLHVRRRGLPFHRVLMIGRQRLTVDPGTLRRLYERNRLSGPSFDMSGDEVLVDAFLADLGADKVHSLDSSNYEGSTLCHDLNTPIPDVYKNGYDIVFDGGSLEHVYNFPVALRSCMDLVRPGGAFLAVAPANNWLGHGFYQFSPELFFRVFDEDAGFRADRIVLAECGESGRMFEVTDPREAGEPLGGLATMHPMSLLVIALKLSDQPAPKRPPQQSPHPGPGQPGAGSASHRAASGTASQIGRLVNAIVPGALARGLQRRAIARRRARDAMRGLREIPSL